MCNIPATFEQTIINVACNAFFNVSQIVQTARLNQIDFRAAFDNVNTLGILYKLCSGRVAGSLFSVVDFFCWTASSVLWYLAGRVFEWMLSQESHLEVSLVSSCLLSTHLMCSQFYGIITFLFGWFNADSNNWKSFSRKADTESFQRYLAKKNEGCSAWTMNLNPSTSKMMVISSVLTVLPRFTVLFSMVLYWFSTLGWNLLMW